MATVETDKGKEAGAPSEGAPKTDPTAAVAKRFNAPEWLVKRRRQAWATYQKLPMPDRVAHLWRYTDPKHFVLTADELVPSTAGASTEAHKFWEDEELSGVALWQAGQVAHLHLDPQLAKAGVVLMDLHKAAREYQRLVEAQMGRAVRDEHGKFEALNTAVWQAGLFLHVPRRVVIDKPIHLIIAGDANTPFLAPRILVGLEEGAQATVVTEFVSPKAEEFAVNTVVEAEVGQAANLRLVGVQRWGDRVTSHYTQRAVLGRDAQLLMVWAGLGAELSKADLGTFLEGRGSSVKLLGMSFGQRGQHFDQHTVHDHRASDTYSDLDFKIVLKDKARSAYTGLIRIEPHATNCEAYQENRNLLLSDGTRADTIPELEILNDEVRCTHGATIGPLDEAELFYLAARGIPREEAIRMVVAGFVEPTLKAVPADLQERLRSYVLDRVKEI
jgi:Fe-S cluster assembly protein SufD